MAFLYVGELQADSTSRESTVNIISEITPEDLAELKKAFSIVGTYHSITQIRNIVIENGEEFRQWMHPQNIQSLHDAGVSIDQLITNANKLVLNYASSTKTFVDMALHLLKHRKPASVDAFKAVTSTFYDSHMEYRFWANFRNYIVHCSFPYCVFNESISDGCEICCPREHLLEFKNWKHSKADIEQMPDFVDLPSLVIKMSSLIHSLYLQFFYYLAPDICSDYKLFESFQSRHAVQHPIIIKTDTPISKETGISAPRMQPLPIKEMMDLFHVMQQHPSIKITIS